MHAQNESKNVNENKNMKQTKVINLSKCQNNKPLKL
jgi:hypothetical protein